MEAAACLAGREPGQQVAQQPLLVLAEGAEQLSFGAVTRAGHLCLDPPPGVGQLRDARPAIVRIEAADAFIEDTPTRWFKQAAPQTTEVEVMRET